MVGGETGGEREGRRACGREGVGCFGLRGRGWGGGGGAEREGLGWRLGLCVGDLQRVALVLRGRIGKGWSIGGPCIYFLVLWSWLRYDRTT